LAPGDDGPNGLANSRGPIKLTRTNADVRSVPGQQPRHPLSHRPRPAQDQRRRTGEIEMACGGPNRCRRRGVGTVGIEKHGDAQPELRQHVPARFRQELLSRADVAAADEECGTFEIFRTTREDSAMDQVADLLRPYSSVAEDFVCAGVGRHDAVEHARLRITIQLNQDLLFFHVHSP
jgi:hypothetical protein